ncbi:unnamed protein product [Tuber aestivum]|uniref:PIN domain-containing protein n=1 Tax=Tuber aestivum TaxID=59557 RepID=A0A292PQV4_9PEZI|nr:unnamed protein product [Tuber aestivum]
MADPPNMGWRRNKVERSLSFEDENKCSVPSGGVVALKQETSGLGESKWAPTWATTWEEGPAAYTQSDTRASDPSESGGSTEADPMLVVDPVLAVGLKESRGEVRAEAERAGYGVLKASFPRPTAGQKRDQRSFYTSVTSEASSSKNLWGMEAVEADYPAPPSQPLATNSRGIIDVEIDDDGDVIMADLEEWQAIREVAHVIAEDRASERTSQGKPEVLEPGERVDDATHILVIDTSFILAHLSLVNDLVLSYMEWGCVVVLPWATIKELDGLKKSNRGIIGVSGQNDSHQIDISMLARAANRWAFQVLSKPEPGIWGQAREEVIDGTFNHGDMAILDCARFFYDQGYDTYLLTNDFNLSVSAIIYKIKAFMYEKGQTCQSLLKKIYGRSQRPRHLPKPKGFLTQTTESKIGKGLGKWVEPRVEVKTGRGVDLGLAQGARAKAIAHILPPNLVRGCYIPPMPTRPHGRNSAISGQLCSPSPDTVRARKSLVGNGMAESIHAPRAREVRETGCAGSYVHSTPPAATAVISTRRLSTLLLEIQADALSSFRAAIKHHILDCFGDEADYLKIYPEDQIRSLYDLESFILKHYCTVFADFIPKPAHNQIVSRYFSGMLHKLEKFSRVPAQASYRPSGLEVLGFIDSLDLLWQMTSAGVPHLTGCDWPVHDWRRRANNDLG